MAATAGPLPAALLVDTLAGPFLLLCKRFSAGTYLLLTCLALATEYMYHSYELRVKKNSIHTTIHTHPSSDPDPGCAF